MLLFIGIPSEPPLAMAISSAEHAGIPYLLLDQRSMHFYNLANGFIKNKLSAVLQVGHKDYQLEKFSGVYYRMMDYASLPQVNTQSLHYIGEDNARKSGLLHQQLLYWMDITKVKVLNPPWTMGSNMSKPGQAQLIKETGLKIPPTCITNDEQFLQQFRQTHKLVIFKSISGIRSIVHELKATNEKMINKIKWLPTQFQQKLEGVNIRVHVVGDVLFATKIETEVTDYRYAQRENKTATPEAFELPKKIAQYCFALSKKLGLTLCGIDLFLTGKGEYYCFEVNPSPGYSYFQSNTGQNISGAIVNWLCYGTAK